MSRIATGTGDRGETGLADGKRLPKDDARIEAYGAVDELNAHLGLVLADAKATHLREPLLRIERELFDLGSDLADPSGRFGVRVTPAQVARLDAEIDGAEAALPLLKRFVLPGGSIVAARLHVARTVCRRAERRLVALSRREKVNPEALRYLNKLSDLLFLLARAANRSEGVADTEVEFK